MNYTSNRNIQFYVYEFLDVEIVAVNTQSTVMSLDTFMQVL